MACRSMITTTRFEGEANFGMQGQRALWRRELRRVLTALRDLIQGAIAKLAFFAPEAARACAGARFLTPET